MTSTLSFKPKTIAIAIAFLIIGWLVFSPKTTNALVGSEFQAGRIIDDTVFYNNNSMSVGQIQSFLNSKLPNCDTSGTLSHTYRYNSSTGRVNNASDPYTTTSRATFGQRYYDYFGGANGSRIPFVCLKDYTETISGVTNSPSDYCTGSISSGTKSAPTIIKEVSNACGINPQVLIVLLQKEQSLVTDDWPWGLQYRSATGYGCPDNNACDSTYYGFFNQVYQAAKAFKRYAANPNSYNYKAGANNAILYHPFNNCGSPTVFIQNQATASLYIYTPYQPNVAALNNLYGTGDSCSSYGNRNFWRMFNDWFGSTTQPTAQSFIASFPVNIVTQPHATPSVGQKIDYVVSFKNDFSFSITLDAVGIVGRAGSISMGVNKDFGWQGPITLAAGASQQFTFSTTIKDLDTIYMWPAVLYQGGYIQYNNWGSTIVSHTPNFTLSQPLTINNATVYAGQNVTFSTVLKNNEAYPIYYDAIGIPVKFYNRYNYDAAWVGPGVIAAGAELTISGTRNIDKPGPFTYWVSNFFGGTYSTIGSVKKFSSIPAAPNFSVSALSFTNSSPVNGGLIEASFTIKNNLPVSITVGGVGVVGRFGTFTGLNRDIGWQGSTTFAAGETKSFTGYSRTISEVGTHYYWIGVLHQSNYIQYNNWGSTIVSTAPNFSVSALSFTNSSPVNGGLIEASFTIKNNLPVSITVGGVGVVGRFGTFTGLNRDIGWQGSTTFAAGETKSFTGYSRTISEVGTHYYWIGVLHQSNYIQYNNWGSTIVSTAS